MVDVANASFIGNASIVSQRDVEVDPHEHMFAVEFQVLDGEFSHRAALFWSLSRPRPLL